MPFWPVVLTSLIAIPMGVFITGMGMIFAAAGYANGSQDSKANVIVYGWLAFAWLLLGAFGAFGVTAAWRAWHGGAENFDGGLHTYAWWLLIVGIGGLLGWVWMRVDAAMRAEVAKGEESARRSLLIRSVRVFLFAVGFLPTALLGAWIVWPLVLWPVHGAFAWPDATTGWLHTGEIVLVLFGLMLLEGTVRRLLKLFKR